MITKFKLFEEIHQIPNYGDYFYTKKYGIGQIINRYGQGYRVKFPNVTNNYITLFDMEYWSENKEELEALITAKKYNL